MIVYGTKLKEIATENFKEKCSNCNSENTIQLAVVQKYAHVFWIPFFPYGKTGISYCNNCKNTLNKKEFTSGMADAYQTMKINSKTPLWTFSGLIIALLIIAWGLFKSEQKDANNAAYLSAPQKGDIYDIKLNYDQYTFYKIDHVNNDSVFFLTCQMGINKFTGISELKKGKNNVFNAELLALSKANIKKMLEDGEILKIERP